jgi:valyl-tRNA synthetase
MASPGTDIAFNVARTEGYRAFANKIWNAARFLFMNVDRAAEIGITVDTTVLGGMPTVGADAPLEARWIVAELHATAAKVNQSLEAYRYDDAANTIYQFFWGSFCDWYLEIVKLRLDFSETGDKAKTNAALTTLVSVFEAALRLLSPFMPFLTEELWHAIYEGQGLPEKSIALMRYPTDDQGLMDYGTKVEMLDLQFLITELRAIRKDLSVPEKQTIQGYVLGVNMIDARSGILRSPADLVSVHSSILNGLARVSPIVEVGSQERYGSLSGLFWRQGMFEVAIDYHKQVNVVAERERLTKDIAKYEKGLAAAERQLGNEGFLAKAPGHIVEGLKKQQAETSLLLDKARAALDELPKG